MCGFVDKMTNMVKLMRCTNLCLTVYFSRIFSGQDTFVYYFKSLHSFCPIFLNENFHTKEDPNSLYMWGTNFAYYMFSCLKVGIFYEKSSFFFFLFLKIVEKERLDSNLVPKTSTMQKLGWCVVIIWSGTFFMVISRFCGQTEMIEEFMGKSLIWNHWLTWGDAHK